MIPRMAHRRLCQVGDRKWTPPVCRRQVTRAAFIAQARPQAAVRLGDSSSSSFRFKVTAKQASSKLRLDTFLATQIALELAAGTAAAEQDVSRAKIQTSISSGLVQVNGRPASKASQQLRQGDSVECSLPPPPPLRAEPEAIPLDVRYEDEHLLVVNKPAGMVVHVAPGHHSGTLVNALLHHCALPALNLQPAAAASALAAAGMGAATAPGSGVGEDGVGGEDIDEDEEMDLDLDLGLGLADSGFPESEEEGVRAAEGGGGGGMAVAAGAGGILRPGIVHRIDKGTSGLLVVAKTEVALRRLQAQFKARTVDRLYISITVGCPTGRQGRVEANIVRDPRDRKRMAAAPYGSGRGRIAASNYTVQSPLAGGGAALVQWQLDTGRTHQIRVHAKHIGHPLLGDETYGGAGTSAVAAVSKHFPADQVRSCVQHLGRPALHALTLAFQHPVTGQCLSFEQPPPEDFVRAVQQLRGG